MVIGHLQEVPIGDAFAVADPIANDMHGNCPPASCSVMGRNPNPSDRGTTPCPGQIRSGFTKIVQTGDEAADVVRYRTALWIPLRMISLTCRGNVQLISNYALDSPPSGSAYSPAQVQH
jgi:hypothetical protein